MSFSSIEFSSVLEFDRSCVFLEFRRIESLWIYLGLKITLNIWKNLKNTITLFISISGKMLFVNLRYYCVYRLACYRANCTTKLVQLDRPITKSNNKFDNTIANTYISIYIGDFEMEIDLTTFHIFVLTYWNIYRSLLFDVILLFFSRRIYWQNLYEEKLGRPIFLPTPIHSFMNPCIYTTVFINNWTLWSICGNKYFNLIKNARIKDELIPRIFISFLHRRWTSYSLN